MREGLPAGAGAGITEILEEVLDQALANLGATRC